MSEDITTQILIQIRQDIAEVRNEVAEVRSDVAEVRNEVATLRSEMYAGFARVNEQIASITAILGHFARSDDRLEIRIAALERHVGISPSG